MGDKPISFRDKDGNFVSAADVWNPKKLEELFTRLNPNRKFRLERERLAKEEAAKHPELNEETEQVQHLLCFYLLKLWQSKTATLVRVTVVMIRRLEPCPRILSNEGVEGYRRFDLVCHLRGTHRPQ